MADARPGQALKPTVAAPLSAAGAGRVNVVNDHEKIALVPLAEPVPQLRRLEEAGQQIQRDQATANPILIALEPVAAAPSRARLFLVQGRSSDWSPRPRIEPGSLFRLPRTPGAIPREFPPSCAS